MSLLEADRSDAAIARAVADGRASAFAELYERHADHVHEYCVRMLGPGADAADATQETFLNVLARLLSGGRPVRDIRAYLFTSARHACGRVAERRQRLSVVAAVPETPSPGAETVALRHETQQDVRTASATLPDRQREILALREVAGLSYRQIGGVMELDENAAAQLAWRARTSLRTAMRRGAVAGVTARTKDCERALTLLVLREDRTLPHEDEQWLDAHLDECDHCRVARAGMLEVGAAYAAVAILPVPDSVRRTIFERAGQVTGEDWSRYGRKHVHAPRLGRVAGIAAALLLAFAAVLAIQSGGDDAKPPPDSRVVAAGAPGQADVDQNVIGSSTIPEGNALSSALGQGESSGDKDQPRRRARAAAGARAGLLGGITGLLGGEESNSSDASQAVRSGRRLTPAAGLNRVSQGTVGSPTPRAPVQRKRPSSSNRPSSGGGGGNNNNGGRAPSTTASSGQSTTIAQSGGGGGGGSNGGGGHGDITTTTTTTTTTVTATPDAPSARPKPEPTRPVESGCDGLSGGDSPGCASGGDLPATTVPLPDGVKP